MKKQVTIIKDKAGVQWSRPLDYLLTMLPNGIFTVTIEKKVRKRTLSQNALMWMWFACISEETGQPVCDIHDTLCQRYLARPAVDMHGNPTMVYKSTSKLTTVEMSEFMIHVQEEAAELGIILPSPEDAYYEDFVNEYEKKIEL